MQQSLQTAQTQDILMRIYTNLIHHHFTQDIV
jgi:hypothetical protein